MLLGRVWAFLSQNRVIVAIIAIAWIWTIVSIARSDRQWDFKTYYYASIAYFAGNSPYQIENLQSPSIKKIELPFVYPPLACYFFRPLTLLPYWLAYQFWLWIKVLVCIYLIWLWRRAFCPRESLALFTLVASLAYISALYRDLAAGNVSVIEQAILWTGFYWFLRGNRCRFAVAIAAASVFKITFVFFLLALLVSSVKKNIPAFILGVGLTATYLAANWIVSPDIFAEFLYTVAGIKELGRSFNHSTLALLGESWQLLSGDNGLENTSGTIIFGIYLIIASAVLFLTIKFLIRVGRDKSDDLPTLTLYALSFAYALIMPRMKNYTFVLLIVPSLYVMTSCVRRQLATLLTLFLILPLIRFSDPLKFPAPYFWFHSWIVAAALWIALLLWRSYSVNLATPEKDTQ
jgi:hypothetical protein